MAKVGLSKEKIVSKLSETNLDESTIEAIASIIDENNDKLLKDIPKVHDEEAREQARRRGLIY